MVEHNLARQLYRARTFSTRMFRHPTWALANIRNYVDQAVDRRSKRSLISVDTKSLETVLKIVSGASAQDIVEMLASVPSPRLQRASALYGSPNGSNELVAFTYALCRLINPDVVLETGVANGFTTASILTALQENNRGQLVSVDLPHLHPDAESSVGAAVDNSIQDRWMLHFGPADSLIPKVLAQVGEVDLFVQDAAHTFRGQIAEYRAGWPFVRTGGLLVSDDVGPGFISFAEEVGHSPIFIQQEKPAPIGVLVKQS